ncbi:hypothetical protein BN8_00786 [Fibrisoma limi BUZ 3]|uniref:Uncharacterized protein n=1 Tax=Fibrisoma limi BUZ 3 TaxID=1185876 RepID=I2GD61_9BACT|nr:hypothetical protein BN8_00786 [Fibrisoma limi BUZ 3]
MLASKLMANKQVVLFAGQKYEKFLIRIYPMNGFTRFSNNTGKNPENHLNRINPARRAVCSTESE